MEKYFVKITYANMHVCVTSVLIINNLKENLISYILKEILYLKEKLKKNFLTNTIYRKKL